MITKRQKQILDFIKCFKEKKGYAPSIEEIKRHFRLSSVSTIHHHLLKLEEKEYIIRRKNEPRAIEILEDKDITKISSEIIKEESKSSHHVSSEKESEETKWERFKEWLNTIQCMDCVEGMKQLPDNCIDLVVTSPPYDNIRKYNGFTYDLHATGEEIFRILKEGGIAVMVIQDQTKNFGKTLTSFRTIVDWCDNIGFKLFECLIYKKYGAEGAWWNKRFRVDHEYMPVFLKGKKPQYFNKEPLKIPSKWGGKTLKGGATRLTSGETLKARPIKINPLKCRGTVWEYLTAGDGSKLKHQHPATFPDKLPYDFIQCFCAEEGVVLDPFMGSGTTAIAAIKLNRNFLGFDISKEYCKLAIKRLELEANFRQKRLI